jgi:transcription elongation factor GreA
MRETLITAEGLARLSEQLERLRTAGRREMTERIRTAISTDADATANADYQAAREEQALLEARIERLERQLEAARIAEPDAANGVVDLGERVRVRDLDLTRLEAARQGGTRTAEIGPAFSILLPRRQRGASATGRGGR